MKKFWIGSIVFMLMIFMANLGVAATPTGDGYTSLNRKVNDLSNRFSDLESNWGRFQIGGAFTLTPTANLYRQDPTLPELDFNQQLNLSLNAAIDPNLQFIMHLAEQGSWGSTATPLSMPLWVDEAYLKMESANNLNYLGRFKFSLGPLGLISDFITDPAEGAAVQLSENNFFMIGLYSRIFEDDYLAFRTGWSNRNQVVGINFVPNGITGEKSVSFDWSASSSTTSLAAEFGLYSFTSDEHPDLNVSMAPGALISYGRLLPSKTFIQFKAGYFSPHFTPIYSSLSYSSHYDREWFSSNSQGVEFFMQNRLKPDLQLENRLIALAPVENFNQPDLGYRWRIDLAKNYSSLNQLQAGVDLKVLPGDISQQVFVQWNVRF